MRGYLLTVALCLLLLLVGMYAGVRLAFHLIARL